MQLVGLALAAVVAWGIALYFSLTRGGQEAAPVADSSASTRGTATVSTASVHAAALPSDEPAAEHTISGAASRPGSLADGSAASGESSPTESPATSTAQPAAGATSVEDPTGCVKSLFAPDTFQHGETDFTFVCTDPYPRTGITKVQAQVLLGRGKGSHLTDGMREWATLGWYQLAAYAVFRGRCCKSPPKLDWTFDLACPLDEAMVALERAVAADDREGLEQAIQQYTKEARCITKLGQAQNFGQSELPAQGMTSFRKLLARMDRGGGG